MGRSPCCYKVGLKKGPWTPEEDQKLLAFVQDHGHGSWRALPVKAGLQRCGKSCRLRWTNYLRPDIKRGQFSLQEEKTIIHLHALLGNRWSAIATHLPKRTDNEIKNYWNTHLKKRLTKMGIDPITHKPKTDTLSSSDQGQSKNTANLSHMAQWESARLEAEARLVRESKLRSQAFKNQAISGQDHLESPTSTLTLSENTNSTPAMFEFVGTSGSSETEILLKDEMSISRFDSGLEDLTLSTNEASHEAWRTSNMNYMDEGFTNLLLNNSDNGQSLSDSDNGCSRSEYEENKNYWNSILNLVNSTPSDSPML